MTDMNYIKPFYLRYPDDSLGLICVTQDFYDLGQFLRTNYPQIEAPLTEYSKVGILNEVPVFELNVSGDQVSLLDYASKHNFPIPSSFFGDTDAVVPEMEDPNPKVTGIRYTVQSDVPLYVIVALVCSIGISLTGLIISILNNGDMDTKLNYIMELTVKSPICDELKPMDTKVLVPQTQQ